MRGRAESSVSSVGEPNAAAPRKPRPKLATPRTRSEPGDEPGDCPELARELLSSGLGSGLGLGPGLGLGLGLRLWLAPVRVVGGAGLLGEELIEGVAFQPRPAVRHRRHRHLLPRLASAALHGLVMCQSRGAQLARDVPGGRSVGRRRRLVSRMDVGVGAGALQLGVVGGLRERSSGRSDKVRWKTRRGAAAARQARSTGAAQRSDVDHRVALSHGGGRAACEVHSHVCVAPGRVRAELWCRAEADRAPALLGQRIRRVVCRFLALLGLGKVTLGP